MDSTRPTVRLRVQRVWRNLGQGLALSWTASPRALVWYSFLSIVTSAMPPVAVYLGALLVTRIADARLHRISMRDTLPIVVGLWLTAVAQRAVGAYMGHGRNLFVRRVTIEAERRLLEKASHLDLAHFDNSDWHDRLSRAKRDISYRPGDLAWSILGLSGNIVTLVLMASLLARLHYVLVLLAVGSAAISLVLEARITLRLYDLFYKETPEQRERDYLGELLVAPRLTKEVRAYVIGDYLLERHRRLSEDLFAFRKRMFAVASRTSTITGVFTGTTLAAAYLFVASEGTLGNIGAGGVVLVIGAFTSVASTLTTISATFAAVDQHTTFLEDYFSFLAIEPLITAPPVPAVIPAGRIHGIEFDNVTFAYPGGTDRALDGLDLSIRPGELVAIVGDNGAGKSTLVKLLLRFYDPQGGAVRVSGVDIRQVDPEALRARIGVLFQDFAAYELSVRENVALGRPSDSPDDDRIIEALREARSDWLLKKMPKGLDSKVGHLFAGGHDLSGGEWQRLALARIIYRDADVWVLDEPTSALDPEAEAAIFAELKEILRDRIGLVISHRFSTVRIADRIAVLSNGRVAEIGTHDDLLRAGGRYAQLFELQAAGYR